MYTVYLRQHTQRGKVTTRPRNNVPVTRSALTGKLVRDPTRIIMVMWVVNIFQIELMVEIYSKVLVRAVGIVLLIKFS